MAATSESHHYRGCYSLIVKLLESDLSFREIVLVLLLIFLNDSISGFRIYGVHNHLGKIFSRNLRTICRVESWSTCSYECCYRFYPVVVI